MQNSYDMITYENRQQNGAIFWWKHLMEASLQLQLGNSHLGFAWQGCNDEAPTQTMALQPLSMTAVH
jgi:hypothetical protein